MVISSRTPEGDRNRCPVCGHRSRVDPSRPPGDAPCPACGHLLWFPPDPDPAGLRLPPSRRPRRPQNPPTGREPQAQAARLVRRLVRRAAGRLGEPDRATAAALAAVRDPRQAERLLSLLHEAKSWKDLLGEWRAEWEKRPGRVGAAGVGRRPR